jgi:hypothetical protein
MRMTPHALERYSRIVSKRLKEAGLNDEMNIRLVSSMGLYAFGSKIWKGGVPKAEDAWALRVDRI